MVKYTYWVVRVPFKLQSLFPLTFKLFRNAKAPFPVKANSKTALILQYSSFNLVMKPFETTSISEMMNQFSEDFVVHLTEDI